MKPIFIISFIFLLVTICFFLLPSVFFPSPIQHSSSISNSSFASSINSIFDGYSSDDDQDNSNNNGTKAGNVEDVEKPTVKFLLPDYFSSSDERMNLFSSSSISSVRSSNMMRKSLCDTSAVSKSIMGTEEELRKLTKSCLQSCVSVASSTSSSLSTHQKCVDLFPSCAKRLAKQCDTSSSLDVLDVLLGDISQILKSNKENNENRKMTAASRNFSSFSSTMTDATCSAFLNHECVSNRLIESSSSSYGNVPVKRKRVRACFVWNKKSVVELLQKSPLFETKAVHGLRTLEMLRVLLNSEAVKGQSEEALRSTKTIEGSSEKQQQRQALLLVDLEDDPCLNPDEDFTLHPILRFARFSSSSTSASRTTTILLPPRDFLLDPTSIPKTSSGIIAAESYGRALTDNIGRCALTSWKRRSPRIGSFCGTMFYPLGKTAQIVHDEMGGQHPPMSKVYFNSPAMIKNDDNIDDEKRRFLFAFGSGQKRGGGRLRGSSLSGPRISHEQQLQVPADWCDASPCSAVENSAVDKEATNEGKPWVLSEGFPLSKVKFAAVEEMLWSSRKQSGNIAARYMASFAAAGAAPIVISHTIDDEIFLKKRAPLKMISASGEQVEFVQSTSVKHNIFEELLFEPWSSYLPVKFFSDYRIKKRAYLFGAEVFNFSESLQNFVDKEDALLQNIASNHRNLVKTMRYGSAIQSAYLAGILVALSKVGL